MSRSLVLFVAVLGCGCSLLAPDDDHFVGGGAGGADAGVGGGGGSAGLGCPALDAPSGAVTDVAPGDAAMLGSIVASAAPGTTIRLAAGTYAVADTLAFAAPNVTLRSATDDASSVILDGQASLTTVVRVTASDVTLAHVTITGGIDYGVDATPEGSDTEGLTLYGVRIVDAGQHAVFAGTNGSTWADGGRIECSLVQLDARRTEACCAGCQPNGIEIVGGRGWQVRKSRVAGIHCDEGSALPFGFVAYGGARDTVVENVTFVDVGRGIGLGFDPDDSIEPKRLWDDMPHGGLTLSHVDGIVRNNVLWANVESFDTGIELNDVRTPLVVHNTVLHGAAVANPFRSIDFRYADTYVVLKNNLASGDVGPRDGAMGDVAANVLGGSTSLVVDAPGGDFHLLPRATTAIDQGVVVPEPGVDIDGETHDAGAGPDIGADELSP